MVGEWTLRPSVWKDLILLTEGVAVKNRSFKKQSKEER
jgi:hypothetical protein